jgi:hypothetical protein
MPQNWAPRAYPFRDPRSGKQENGRIVNPPRAQRLGGKGETRIWDQNGGRTEGPSGKGPVSDRGRGRR